MNRKLCIIAATLGITLPAGAQQHIWSKQGTVFNPFNCRETISHIRSKRSYSPDHSRYLEFSWVAVDGSPSCALSLVEGSKTIDVPFNILWVQTEAVWSPDSVGFALTGNLNAYTESTTIFRITDGTLHSVAITSLYRDMSKAYPPCRAANQVLDDCRKFADATDFNYATVAWASPTTAVIMAEVPCDSLWGGIMCQVEGYEFDTATQTITSRLNAREFKREWQPALAWRFRMPGPPEWNASAP